MSSRRQRHALTLIELVVVIAILAILIGMILPAIQKIREAAARVGCQNNLRQIGLALHGYHDAHKTFPPGFSRGADGGRYTYLGWEARILPHLEMGSLWTQVETAYRTDPNRYAFYGHQPQLEILRTVVTLFTCPSDARVLSPVQMKRSAAAFTSYQGVIGKDASSRDGVLFVDSRVGGRDITDGLSQTIVAGERPPPADRRFGWWYRGWGQRQNGSAEMVLGVREVNVIGERYPCPLGPYQYALGDLTNQCSMFHFWSLHSGGAFFLLGDGVVRFLPYSANELMPALSSRAGSEVVSDPF